MKTKREMERELTFSTAYYMAEIEKKSRAGFGTRTWESALNMAYALSGYLHCAVHCGLMSNQAKTGLSERAFHLAITGRSPLPHALILRRRR